MAGNAFTYRFSGAYLIDATKTKLRASYGTAFKAPDLFDTFSTAAFALGNRGLRPETSRGYDVGFDQYLWDSGVTFSASFFQNYIHDVEDFSFFPAKYVRLNDYWVLRTYARWQVNDHLAFTFRVENLSDQHYYTTIGYPALGTAVFGGAEIHF